MDTTVPLVIDIGTGFIKAGFADGSNLVRHEFPSIIGRPILRAEEGIGNTTIEDVMCGHAASSARSSLQITSPIEHGIIQNWEDMKLLWDYTFNELLKTETKGRKILLTEPLMNPPANRQRMAQIMFEVYGFDGVYISQQPVLSLYARGTTTGVVLNCGDGVSQIVPVYHGIADPNLTRHLAVAGGDITRYLIKLLAMRGYAFSRTADVETMRELKERWCYISNDLELDERLAEETTSLLESQNLPDGRKVQLGPERFRAPECLFQPHLIDVEQPGIAGLLFNVIQSAPIDTRADLYNNVVLSGGSTMFPGFPSRLEKEVMQLRLAQVTRGDDSKWKKIKVIDSPQRKHSVFVGASVLAQSMQDHETFWVSRAEWDELGPQRALMKLDKAV